MPRQPRTLAEILTTEKHFQQQVSDYAKLRGWTFYHPWSSRHSAAGFPDCTFSRGRRLIFAELKREGKHPTPAQRVWLEQLDRVECVEVYVWHPSDWDEIMRVLE